MFLYQAFNPFLFPRWITDALRISTNHENEVTHSFSYGCQSTRISIGTYESFNLVDLKNMSINDLF